MSYKICTHYRLPAKVSSYLVEYYARLSDKELCYEYLQPYCEYCQSTLRFQNNLPQFCTSCGTHRWDDSPLMLELDRRGISETTIFSLQRHFEKYAYEENEHGTDY